VVVVLILIGCCVNDNIMVFSFVLSIGGDALTLLFSSCRERERERGRDLTFRKVTAVPCESSCTLYCEFRHQPPSLNACLTPAY
jgi:hypothetical protein